MIESLSPFRRGDWIEVRSAAEIRATLDEDGRVDGLPFMPEMLRFCGQRLRVAASAHKTCDTITLSGLRHAPDTVHLEGARCDGSAHGGCQALCLLFWKTAWLKPVVAPPQDGVAEAPFDLDIAAWLGARAEQRDGRSGEPRYVCQATELLTATRPIPNGALRHYWWDLRTGNVGPVDLVRYLLLALFNKVQRRRGGRVHPIVEPRLSARTPAQRLDLRPGERTRVRSRDEIEKTLGPEAKNRGLSFDVEMLPHCGKDRRVLDRVERIVDEKTGRLIQLKSDCLILEDATCSGNVSCGRLFCPRAIYPFWREVWLERVEGVEELKS